MKSRYDGAPGKDAKMERTRQARFEAEHNASNEFVKREQMATRGMAGKAPKLSEKSMAFDAYMCNDGEHAQEFGRMLTKGLDKVAFPVK